MIAWLTWLALGGLLVLVVVSVIGAFNSVGYLAEFLPVLAPTKGQLAVIAMAFGVCVLVILVATGVLVGYTRSDRIFRPATLRWVDVLVGAFVVGTAVVVAALFFIPGPPQLFLLVEACVPTGIAITLVLLVMRALLRRAVAMQVELDEVV
ncbi:DUF2975 domain-containing protein [Microbacterium protaetiae]|uniref:DUF2975 domain-containing protein n=1 Tax=Microbacterium protaetiae TaxID=2509458 RepID=UPI0013E9E7FC|nr:DUF2975 domain-containing protein [Microbacterium protaetiae]